MGDGLVVKSMDCSSQLARFNCQHDNSQSSLSSIEWDLKPSPGIHREFMHMMHRHTFRWSFTTHHSYSTVTWNMRSWSSYLDAVLSCCCSLIPPLSSFTACGNHKHTSRFYEISFIHLNMCMRIDSASSLSFTYFTFIFKIALNRECSTFYCRKLFMPKIFCFGRNCMNMLQVMNMR